MPDWFPLVRAAHFYGIAPWELLERPKIWTDWALAADGAWGEAQARAARQPWRK